MVKNTMIISINLDNDAFQNGNRNAEIVRILRSLADKLESYQGDITAGAGIFGNLRDINGNPVGTFDVEQHLI